MLERPSIPPLLWFSLPLWASCAAGTALVPECGYRAELILVLVLVLATIVFVLYAMKMNSAFIICAVGIVVGFMLVWVQGVIVSSATAALEGPGKSFRIELIEDPIQGDFTTSARAIAFCEDGRKAKVRVEGDCLANLICHDAALCTGRFVVPTERTHRRLWLSGCAGTLKASVATRLDSPEIVAAINAFRRNAIHALRENGASELTLALACGWRQELLASSTYDKFKQVGLAHLVAVSGAHLVIVTSLFAAIMKLLKLPRKLTFALLLASMILYYFLAGAPVSALRALVMSSIGLASFSAKRRPHALNALGLAMAFMITFDPSSAVSISFALSALSTLGIVLFARLMAEWFPASQRGQLVFQPMALTLSAALFSLPLASSIFAQLPLVSPLSNILAAPLFAPSCALSLLSGIVGVACPSMMVPILALCGGCTGLIESLANLISYIPFCCIPIEISVTSALGTSALIAAVLWITWPTRARKAFELLAALAVVGVVVLSLRPSINDAIIMFDVGQGDAFLIKSESRSLLIDTGNQDALLLKSLGRHGFLSLDAVAISHADDDHCGALEALGNCVEIGCVILSNPTFEDDGSSSKELFETARKASPNVVGVAVGDSISFGSFEALCLSPRQLVEDGGNADSLCLLIGYDPDHDGIMDAHALFSGDAESDVLDTLVREGAIGSIDVLKVAHHGSDGALSKELIDVLRPRVALISCGENNPYGHPAKRTIELLETNDVPVFRTDCQGEVICSFSPGGVSIRTER